MLDTRNPIVLEDVADITVYRDDAERTAFYALPAKPRLALDDQGRPQLSLVAYGSRGPSGFKARGGILTVTTGLQLSADETERVRQSLIKWLKREFPQPDDAPPLLPELRPMDWMAGTVELQVVAGLSATGSPSLFGGNQFSYSANLDAQTVGDVLLAWERRLPDASITYRLTARAPGRSTSSTRTVTYEAVSVDDVTSHASIESNLRSASSGGMTNQELAFTGPLLPPDADPGQFLNLQVL
jgi:hypothetical protein